MIKLNWNKINENWKKVEDSSYGGRVAKKYCNYYLEKRDEKNYYFVEKVNLIVMLFGLLVFLLLTPFIGIYLIGLGITKVLSPIIEKTTGGRIIQDALNGLFHKGVIRDDHMYEKDIDIEKYGITQEQLEQLKGVSINEQSK